MVVIDASALVKALLDDTPGGDAARRRLRDSRLVAPQLIDFEVLHAMRRASMDGRLEERRAHQTLDDLMRIPVRRAPHRRLIPRIWALRHNLSAYDAAYVALAEAIDAPLLTADRRLAAAPGVECEIELIA